MKRLWLLFSQAVTVVLAVRLNTQGFVPPQGPPVNPLNV